MTSVLPSPYVDDGDLERDRRLVEELVCDLPGGSPDQLSFEKPWEIRAFALAVTAYHAKKFDWGQFQSALIASIAEWESRGGDRDSDPWSYYEHWLVALEGVMEAAGDIDAAALDARTAEVLATPANRNHHEAHPEPIAIDPAR
ncbi:nitrile hydratase accessory protein [Microbacterium sp. SORGH_AS_0888]|uniref:nitrile hydratase accessory protein n=1 Tax=Microbacterium sp. SORGH_AS_0888 TaxID=3041791 RepID=UPI002783E202|nr:nitrile hydratase accessory protein [Microbacterium sp. SORGH_AS_0888]MDQ1128107.1 nitrile hydratase accessory protein [Microbacterium sp. SORGH_AS_0888]